MKLLVCGEGASELGHADEDEGVAITLVRRLLDDDTRCIEISTIGWASLPRDPEAPRGDDEQRKARAAVRESRLRGCDGLVLIRDADREGEARRRQLEPTLAAGAAAPAARQSCFHSCFG